MLEIRRDFPSPQTTVTAVCRSLEPKGRQEETSRKRPDPSEPEQRYTNAVPGTERRGKRDDANEHIGYSVEPESKDRLRP